MDTVIFTKDTQGFFDVQALEYDTLNNLSLFLVNEIVDDPSWWLDYLEGQDTKGVVGNIIYVDKKEEYICLGNDRPIVDDPHIFIIQKHKLISIIKKWEHLYSNDAIKTIFLTYDNEKITLESS